jgi:hypothetical protein
VVFEIFYLIKIHRRVEALYDGLKIIAYGLKRVTLRVAAFVRGGVCA